ncbi:MAG TPA: iron chelate uptake ABC transporter family permease subunit [Acidobacteriota bacterium]|jgi:iron complex transport system permease protein|nr:iron chelate uptake ABC transporter family permease subunit [Acidobacteriota bacterium]
MSSRVYGLTALFLVTILAASISLFIGPVRGAPWAIIWQIRLPRVLLALLVGFALAGAGAVFQGVLRNPLADPFILGTSGAAAAGVMTAGILSFRNYSALYLMSLGFALLSIFVVYRIARVNGKTPIQTIILAGVIVSLFCNAAVFVFFSIFYRESFTMLFYLLGTLTEGNPALIAISGTIICAGLFVTWLFSRELNALTQGEETAFHLGVSVETTKKVLFVAASAMVAAAVSVAGMIGFVGLIVPHMMRMLVGPDHRVLIPASALGGAVFLIVADALARTVLPPLEIPVGALTALVGSPYFVYLLHQKQKVGEF